jgi:hypothetical protein
LDKNSPHIIFAGGAKVKDKNLKELERMDDIFCENDYNGRF